MLETKVKVDHPVSSYSTASCKCSYQGDLRGGHRLGFCVERLYQQVGSLILPADALVYLVQKALTQDWYTSTQHYPFPSISSHKHCHQAFQKHSYHTNTTRIKANIIWDNNYESFLLFIVVQNICVLRKITPDSFISHFIETQHLSCFVITLPHLNQAVYLKEPTFYSS